MDSQSQQLLATLQAHHEHMMSMDEYNNNHEGETLLAASESETPSIHPTQTVFDSNKRLKADVWKEFIPIETVEEDGKSRGRRVHCSKKMFVEISSGTSACKRHLDNCPKRPRTDGRDNRGRLIYDPKIDRQMISEIIIYHDLPFKYVAYEKVRERDKYLNPDCKLICRQTAGADVYRRYELEKAKLKEVLARHKGRINFTPDLWSATTTMMGYVCLTAHYIDNGWRLNSKVLAFCEFKPPHTGEEIAKKILDYLKEWSLEKKVFSITLDNATSNDSMQKILKHRLQMVIGNRLPCDGKYLHVRCCAHALNLIVKKGLELAGNLLEKIRDSVKFVKASQSRKDAFDACIESVGETRGSGLSLDVSTRWNSTYEMLARALKFRKAFTSLQLCDRSYKCLPSEDEWDRGEKIRDMLKLFSTITTYILGVNYPTANVYFSQVWKIECLLRNFSHCDDTAVREMAKSMQSKFTKYWDEYSIVLAMAAVLDPRIKLQILRVAFDKLDPRTSERKVEVVKKSLYALYEEYKTTKYWSSWTSVSTVLAPPTAYELLNESPLEDDMNYDLFELEKSIQPGSVNEKTNLDLYLNEPRLEMKSFTDMEVLDYWKNHGKRHGDLASLASDLLSILITTMASESAFSIGSRVLTPYRNRLLPKNVQALLCTRNWLRGFADFEGDIEDLFDDGDDDASSSRT